MEFTFQNFRMYERVDGLWGIKVNNTGEWDGIIRSLLLGDVDLGWSVFTINEERREAVDFLKPVMMRHMCLVSGLV